MSNLQVNNNTFKKPMTEAAKKFFASPSKLSKSKRFKGVYSETIMTRASNQANGVSA
jgi:hypothetical protein